MNITSPPFADPITTQGDLIVGGALGAPARLPAGALNQALLSAGPAQPLVYGAAGMANPMTMVGDLIVGGVAGAPAALAAGATGQTALLTNGAAATPSWGSPPSAQDVFYRPAAALFETFSRIAATGGTFPTTAILFLTSIYLPAGLTIGHIAFMSGAGAANTPLNNWFGLYDNNRVQLATTADQGAAAWASNTLKSLAIATIASGAATTFVTTYSGLHYLGFMMKATTTINLQGISVPLDAVAAVSPLVAGNSDTAQTTPPAFPHTATAISGTIGTAFYGYVAA